MALASASSFAAVKILPFSSAFSQWREPFSSSTLPFTRYRLNAPPVVICSSLSDRSGLLLQAAKHAIDSYVQSGMLVGLGSGRAARLAIHYLGLQLKAGMLKDIVGIPTCVGSASEAAKAGIPLEQYEESSKIDIAFCDADIIQEETLSAVIGRRKLTGEESIIYEKTVLGAAKKLVFVVSEMQYTRTPDGAIPVLIQPFNWMETAEEIDDLFLGDAEVWRRPSIGHADPLGGDFPMVTKDGHNVLDVIFTSPITSLADVADSLNKVDGVVDHGVICQAPCTAIVATENGLQIVENNSIFGAGSLGQI